VRSTRASVSWSRAKTCTEADFPFKTCASITVTAHTYADLFDDELDNTAAALDSLDDLSQST
jgi:hypothetical protein